MKAGLVIYGDLETPTGGYLYDRMLVRHLRARGDRVEVISMPHRRAGTGLLDNLDPRLLRRLLELDAEVLLEDELNHPSLCLLNERFRRSSEMPIIPIVHHLSWVAERNPCRAARSRILEQRYLRTADGFIFNSWATRCSVLELVPGAEGAVAHPGRDHIAPLACSREGREGPLTVLYLGNIMPHKGLDVLVRAIAKLPRSAVRLDVVGAALDTEYLLSVGHVVAAEGLGEVVRFHGRLAEKEKVEMMCSADVLVMPSYHEGYGLVIVEAMAAGLPVIAPASGGAREIISDRREGFLCEGGDEEGIAGNLRALINPSLRAEMSACARARFEHLPTWETEMERARAYLERIVGQSPKNVGRNGRYYH
ncbi:MAG: glycosyltransferase family 4 protein [Methanomassiliicoccus sp.]|nr:glycosyltransferase family 4 protein [Methanomassiliicoccus sp.]